MSVSATTSTTSAAVVAWGLDREDAADRDLALLVIAHLGLEASLDRTRGVGTWALRAISGADDAEPWIRSAVLGAAAEDLRSRNEFDEAIRLADAGLRDGVRLAGPGPAGPHGARAHETDERRGRSRTRRDAHQHGDHARPRNDLRARIVATVASSIAGFAGRMDDAEAVANEAFAIAEAMGSPTIVTGAFYRPAATIDTQQPDEALRCYEECISDLSQRCKQGGVRPGARSRCVPLASARRRRDGTRPRHRVGRAHVEHGRPCDGRNRARGGSGHRGGPGRVPGGRVLLRARSSPVADDAVAGHDPRWQAAYSGSVYVTTTATREYERLWNRVARSAVDKIVVQGLTEMQPRPGVARRRRLREQVGQLRSRASTEAVVPGHLAAPQDLVHLRDVGPERVVRALAVCDVRRDAQRRPRTRDSPRPTPSRSRPYPP